MNKKSLALFFAIALIMLLSFFTIAAQVKASPITIIFDPTSGTVGTEVVVQGAADTFNGQVEIYWDLPGNVLETTMAVGYDYSATITIPEAVAGTHVIGARDVTTTETAARDFVVESSIVLSQEEGPIGTNVTVSGTGFAIVSSIDVTWDAKIVLETDSDEHGSFTGSFFVPPSVAGDHNVMATDGDGNTDSAPFTVWSITISISPTSGRIGTIMTVNGTYATPGKNVTILWDSVPVDNTTAQTDGTYSYDLTVPPSGAGAHVITVLDVESANNASETFTVLPIEISIDPDSGPVETEVTISGSCATPVANVTILWDSVEVANVTTSADGTYAYLLTVPPSVNGEHTITAVDLESTNNASDTFTVVALITLGPEDGLVGDVVSVTGTGFSGLSEVDVYFDVNHNGVPDSEELVQADVPTNETGSFESNFTVPWVSIAGDCRVMAIDAEDLTDDATFTVLFVMYTRSNEYFQGDYPSFFIQAVDEDGEPLEGVLVVVEIHDPDGYLQHKSITFTTEDGTVPYDAQFFSWMVWDFSGMLEHSPIHLSSDAAVGTWTWNATASDDLWEKLTVSNSFEVVEPVDLRTLLEKLDQLLTGQDDTADMIVYYGDKLQLEHDELAALIAAVSDELQMDHEELANLVSDVFAALELKLDDIADELVSIEEKVDGLYLVLGDLELKLDDINAMIVGIEGKIATIETDIGTIKADVDDIQAKLVSIQGDLATINSTLGEIQVKIDNLGAVSLEEIKQDIATIKSEIGTIKVHVSNINANITSIKGRLVTIETTVGTIEEDISDINGEIVAVKDDMVMISTDIGDAEASLNDINAKITVINDNVATIETDIGTIEGRLTSIEGDVATIETDIGTIETTTDSIQTTGESIKTDTGLQPATVGLSLIAAIAAIAAAVMVLRKVYVK